MKRTRSDDKDLRGSPARLGRRESLAALPPGSPRSLARASTMGPAAGGQTGPSATSAGAISNATLAREVEDLKSTIKVLEKKRTEDRDKLKALERVQSERDQFETIIRKLQCTIETRFTLCFS